MKHLRIALEDEDVLERQEELGDLSQNVEALASITDGMPEMDEGPSSISMESILRYKPSGCEELVAFRISMEDVSVGVIGAIIAAVAAVVALIVKAVQYFTGGKSGSTGGAIASSVEKRDDIKKSSNQNMLLLTSVDQSLGKDPVNVAGDDKANEVVKSLADLLKKDEGLMEKFKHMVEQSADVLLIHADRNVFIQLVHKFNMIRNPYEHLWRDVQAKYDESTNLLLMDIRPDDKRSIDQYQAALADGAKSNIGETFMRGIDGKDQTVYDVAAMFKAALEEAQGAQLHGIPGIKEVNENIASYFSNPHVDQALKIATESMAFVRLLANQLSETEHLLKSVQHDRNQLEAREQSTGATEITGMLKEGNALLSKAMTDYTRHIRAMVSITNDIVAYSNHLNQTHDKVMATNTAIISALLHHIDEMPAEQATELRAAVEQMKQSLK